MIAITGASGNLGKAILTHLLEKTAASGVIAIVREPARISDFAGKGIEVRKADYDDPESLQKALSGVDTLVQISSSANGPEAAGQEANVVTAAVTSRVRHVIYTSTLSPEPGAFFLAAQTCGNTESLLRASGIGYTFFRNSMYHETVPLFVGNAMHDGQVYYPTETGRVSFVSRTDIAEAIANLLIASPTRNEALDITGPESLSFPQVTSLLRASHGLDAEFHLMSLENYEAALLDAGLHPGEAAFYVSMAKSIDAGEFARTDTALEKLLGRKPLTLKKYLESLAAN